MPYRGVQGRQLLVTKVEWRFLVSIIDELIEAAEAKEAQARDHYEKDNGKATESPTPLTPTKPQNGYGKRPSKSMRDLVRWRQHQQVHNTFTIRSDLDQITSPVNSWKDTERDETVYLPHNIVQLGPISELLAKGEVLFQSRSYVNPLIVKAVVGESSK
jgi:hypothetical protein